jgi:hypothetical protein
MYEDQKDYGRQRFFKKCFVRGLEAQKRLGSKLKKGKLCQC